MRTILQLSLLLSFFASTGVLARELTEEELESIPRPDALPETVAQPPREPEPDLLATTDFAPLGTDDVRMHALGASSFGETGWQLALAARPSQTLGWQVTASEELSGAHGFEARGTAGWFLFNRTLTETTFARRVGARPGWDLETAVMPAFRFARLRLLMGPALGVRRLDKTFFTLGQTAIAQLGTVTFRYALRFYLPTAEQSVTQVSHDLQLSYTTRQQLQLGFQVSRSLAGTRTVNENPLAIVDRIGAFLDAPIAGRFGARVLVFEGRRYSPYEKKPGFGLGAETGFTLAF